MRMNGSQDRGCTIELLEKRQLLSNVGYTELDFRVTGLVAHPTRNEVVLVGNDRKLRVVDTNTGKETRQVALSTTPGRAAISPDGRTLLIVLPSTNQVQVISLSDYTTTALFDVGNSLTDIAVGTGGRFYGAWGTGSSIINQYDISSGAKVTEVFRYASAAPMLCVDSTGNFLYFVSVIDQYRSTGLLHEYDVSNASGVVARKTYQSAHGTYPLADIVNDRILLPTRSGYGVNSYLRSNGRTSQFWWPMSTDIADQAIVGSSLSDTFYVGAEKGQDSVIYQVEGSTRTTRRSDLVPGNLTAGSMVMTANGRVSFFTTPTESSNYAFQFGIVGTPAVSLTGGQALITGEVFNDKNGNFRRDKGEYWFYPSGETASTYRAPQALVYLDLNRDGRFDRDLEFGFDLGWQTQSFRFPVDRPGTYDIRAIPKIDDSFVEYDRAIYSTKMATVTIAKAGQQIANANLPFSAGFRARGVVFADGNGNGKRESQEPLLSGAVFFDRNNNGVRDRREILVDALNEEDAFYRYEEEGFVLDSPPGAGVLRLVADPKTVFTTPSSLSVPGLGAAEYVVDFGIAPALKLTGVIYDDKNGNARRDNGESPREQIRVWLDANLNDRFDKGERSAFSDASGKFTLTHSTLNTDLRVLLRSELSNPLFYTHTPKYVFFSQWNQTINVDYGLYPAAKIIVNVFEDDDDNGKLSNFDDLLDGVELFVDRDRNGELSSDENTFSSRDGIVRISDLVAGEYYIGWIHEFGRTPKTSLPLKVKVKAGETKTVYIAFRG